MSRLPAYPYENLQRIAHAHGFKIVKRDAFDAGHLRAAARMGVPSATVFATDGQTMIYAPSYRDCAKSIEGAAAYRGEERRRYARELFDSPSALFTKYTARFGADGVSFLDDGEGCILIAPERRESTLARIAQCAVASERVMRDAIRALPELGWINAA